VGRTGEDEGQTEISPRKPSLVSCAVSFHDSSLASCLDHVRWRWRVSMHWNSSNVPLRRTTRSHGRSRTNVTIFLAHTLINQFVSAQLEGCDFLPVILDQHEGDQLRRPHHDPRCHIGQPQATYNSRHSSSSQSYAHWPVPLSQAYTLRVVCMIRRLVCSRRRSRLDMRRLINGYSVSQICTTVDFGVATQLAGLISQCG